ncbi:nickel-responsive transcriptional regulator NikR [Paracraurococcus ruber]|uniref:Putative nickel-responsive regulator n=1 Tax=Paracraurococcus ruber TaxID=77675 RepID=A0ABS1CW57_9PROT|nr:nickel-responsive transcriptional regulator NikR [Paracraurococcus ruber]MBK1658565.1 nickel-responsive transcriptional regulator NikR [Paracraurococcus ruber]TDG30895.1 nickel-responsive transcriptional regulator NikR [Paracraurococcus ruber]
MHRITITIDEELLAVVDALAAAKGYASRSEAIRDLLRAETARTAALAPATPCVATLSYVYDHAARDLARRLAAEHHAHHDLSIASLHVHLDHDSCLEVAALRGQAGAVRRFADAVTAGRGVRHHALHMVPARVENAVHDHGAGATKHTHIHA